MKERLSRGFKGSGLLCLSSSIRGLISLYGLVVNHSGTQHFTPGLGWVQTPSIGLRPEEGAGKRCSECGLGPRSRKGEATFSLLPSRCLWNSSVPLPLPDARTTHIEVIPHVKDPMPAKV